MTDRFERFSFAIFEISKCWHRLAAEEMAKYGLKGPHALYLATLRNYPEGITATQLCELCGRDKADVSRAMGLMERKGLLVKQGESAYRAPLKLTDVGKQAAEQVCGRANLAVELAGKDISEEDRKILYAALESITANLHRLTKEGLPNDESI